MQFRFHFCNKKKGKEKESLILSMCFRGMLIEFSVPKAFVFLKKNNEQQQWETARQNFLFLLKAL